MEFTVLYIACEERAFIVVVGTIRTTAKTRNPPKTSTLRDPGPVLAVPDTEYCCDGMVVLSVAQLDRFLRSPHETWTWKTDYGGHRNPSEGSNSAIEHRGGLGKRSCGTFGLAAHTLAALTIAAIHNLRQTQLAQGSDSVGGPFPAGTVPFCGQSGWWL